MLFAAALGALVGSFPAAASARSCDAARMLPVLRALDRNAAIELAAPRAAGKVPTPFGPPQSAPAHCEILARLEQRLGANGQHYAIRFHLRLPDAWNKRFFFQGGGGIDGDVGDALGLLAQNQPGNALSLGYAVVSQDSGHDNALNNDPARQGAATFGWDARARHNYGFAALGIVATAAKALIRAYYGMAPRYSYFVGGSKGGQEAFMVTQRFPAQFDGVVAGFPGFRLATAALAEVWDSQSFAQVSRQVGFVDADGLPLLGKSFSDSDLALAAGAILSACDALDGTVDGIIDNFTQCTDRIVLPRLSAVTCTAAKNANCLSATQVDALEKVFGGPRGRDGRPLYASWPWDAGIGGVAAHGYFHGWRDWKIGSWDSTRNNAFNILLAGGTVSAIFISPPVPVRADPQSLTRYMLKASVEANDAASRVKWGGLRESAVDFMNADSTDLSAFAGHGGKLLVYQGVSDPVFSINDTIAWWRAVDRREKGAADNFVRLFAVPGMNHGGGGPSTDRFDAFGAVVNWVERGHPPDRLVANAGPDTLWPGRTRLLCPYPQQPRRDGRDIERATSFHCITP